ncbi:Uncharacterised protein [Acinetobacter baumannii]|nr:Uncharacterised protein [Acinetobacter baumannii]
MVHNHVHPLKKDMQMEGYFAQMKQHRLLHSNHDRHQDYLNLGSCLNHRLYELGH